MSYRVRGLSSVAVCLTIVTLYFVSPYFVGVGWARGSVTAIVVLGLLAALFRRLRLRVFEVYCTLGCGMAIAIALIYFIQRFVPVELLIGGTIFLTVVTVVLTVMRKKESRRGEMGLCENCGYDLRESFDRCPECGGPIPSDLQRRRRIAKEIRKTSAMPISPPTDSSVHQ